MPHFRQVVIIENEFAVQMLVLEDGKLAQACKKCGGAGVCDSKRYSGYNPCESCKTTGHQKKVFENEQAVIDWFVIKMKGK